MGLRLVPPSVILLLLLHLSFAYGFDGTLVRHQWDVFYTTEKDSLQRLDVYWNDGSGSADVIVFAHGGGWLSGDKKTYRNMAAILAGRGMTVVLVNYRLSPKVKFPSHVEDVAAAIAWTYAAAQKYNGDQKKIYLMGHSAGAHLISLVAWDEKYLAQYNLGRDDISGLITISGVFEIKTQQGGATKQYLGMVFGNEEAWADATVQHHIGESKSIHPPFLITWVDGEGDLIKNESLNMMAAFSNAGLTCRSFVFEGNDHMAFVTALQDKESPFSQKVLEFIADSQPQK